MYLQQLDHVQQALNQKEPALVNHKVVLFLHDNTKPHMVQVARNTYHSATWLRDTVPYTLLPKTCVNKLPLPLPGLLWEIFKNEANLWQALRHPKCLNFAVRALNCWSYVGKSFWMTMRITLRTNSVSSLLYTFCSDK